MINPLHGPRGVLLSINALILQSGNFLVKIYSKPLTLYEIDLLHYSSNNSDKEYFVDALILKALDKDANNLFSFDDRQALLSKDKSILERMYLQMFENELGSLKIVSN